MILLVVLMLSAEAGSGAVTSIEDPEPPSDVPVCKPVELCSKSQSFGKETDASFNYDPPATTFGFELKESGNEVIK